MSARVPFAPQFDQLVYLRVFEGCNLHCEHCFIPKNPKRMTLETIKDSAQALSSILAPGQRILAQWHGGEPTMFGPRWLEDAMDSLETAAPEFTWMHGLQTNLMTYNPEWGDLYHRRFGSSVGVSWDPVIRLLAKGRPETNAAYEERFWKAMDALLQDGVEPYLVVTGTRVFFETFRNPITFFEMLSRRGIRKAHIERVTETGYARENWGRLGVDNAQWSRYMSRFLRAYELWRTTDDNGSRFALSPFDGLVASVANMEQGAGGYGCLSGKCDTTFHTIDASGYKRGCTALTSEVDNPRAHSESLKFDKGFESARRERRMISCVGCPFRKVCSSGCLALSMDDGSGECSGGRKLFEAVVDVVKIKSLQGEDA